MLFVTCDRACVFSHCTIARPVCNTTTASALAPATLTHLDAGRAACGFECGEGSEEDALPRTEGHRAVVGDGDAVKLHEHVSLAQHLQQQQWAVGGAGHNVGSSRSAYTCSQSVGQHVVLLFVCCCVFLALLAPVAEQPGAAQGCCRGPLTFAVLVVGWILLSSTPVWCAFMPSALHTRGGW